MSLVINQWSEPHDITQNSENWSNALIHPKTQETMTQMIKFVLGEAAASLPEDAHPRIMKVYCHWACGRIGDKYICDKSPVARLKKSSHYVTTMICKEHLHGHPHFNREEIILSQNNIPAEDTTPKANKFIDVIRTNPHIQEQFLQKNVKDFAFRDVGGGDGSMALAIQESLHLNNKPKIYEVATYKGQKCEVVQYAGDGSIPEKNNSIDLATMNMVLHHVEDPDKTLSELHRVMKDGAIFIMRETDTEGDDGIDSFQHVMDHHWYHANPHSSTVEGVPLKMQFRNTVQIKELFEKNGFKLLDVKTHKKDIGSAFNAKFYIFKSEKNCS
jgi:ubiquinone/menaquinone biosynthesis C-methylase UbiE